MARPGGARPGRAWRGKARGFNLTQQEGQMRASKTITRQVTLTGLTEILFDPYAGDNKTKLAPEQKMYFLPGGKGEIVLPALNILSFLAARNTVSAPQLVIGGKGYGAICDALLASVTISPSHILFLRDGKPIIFGGKFIDDVDPLSGITVVRHVARLLKGIPNPKERPMLGLPWQLKFTMSVLPHDELNEKLIENLFVDGGVRLGLGTFRKAFGKFTFDWE
jgi:hypothetical protein